MFCLNLEFFLMNLHAKPDTSSTLYLNLPVNLGTSSIRPSNFLLILHVNLEIFSSIGALEMAMSVGLSVGRSVGPCDLAF